MPRLRDPVGELLLVLIVSLVLGFVVVSAWEGQYAMNRCQEQFSQTTCDHILGR